MSTQQLVFNNQTTTPLDLAVWQLPLPPAALLSVCWMRLRAFPGGSAGQQWDDSLAIVLALFQQDAGLGRFSIRESKDTESGRAWIIVTVNGNQLLVDAGEAPSNDEVLAMNSSAGAANVGLAQSGAAVFYAQDLLIGAEASLPTTRTYMAGLFMDVSPGDVVNPAQLVAVPMPLVYPPGMTQATATAVLQSSGIVLTITYGV
jgi:hypothetical protein